MADFIPYQHPTPRDVSTDNVVRLSPDRWKALVAWYIAPPYIDSSTLPVEIEIIEPVEVNDVLYLPALYRAA